MGTEKKVKQKIRIEIEIRKSALWLKQKAQKIMRHMVRVKSFKNQSIPLLHWAVIQRQSEGKDFTDIFQALLCLRGSMQCLKSSLQSQY